MRFTKRQLVKIIREQVATINDEAIDDAVMSVLSDEGGAAGIDPIEAALNDLEDEDMSLPDEEIEDIISSVTGVKQHADGDFIDTTQLEGKALKITKRQLRRIVKEEAAKLRNKKQINESITDMTTYQDMFEKAALEISDKFYVDMMKLYDEEPDSFARPVPGSEAMERVDRDVWEQQVVYSQQEIDTGIAQAMGAALEQIEMKLHDGQYDDGRG